MAMLGGLWHGSSPGREAFLASPAFHPIENAIPHLAPKKVGGHVKNEMRDLRYRARLRVGTFLVARAVVVEVDERMLEHASTPFVYILSGCHNCCLPFGVPLNW